MGRYGRAVLLLFAACAGALGLKLLGYFAYRLVLSPSHDDALRLPVSARAARTQQPVELHSSPAPAGVSAEAWAARIELAALYRCLHLAQRQGQRAGRRATRGSLGSTLGW